MQNRKCGIGCDATPTPRVIYQPPPRAGCETDSRPSPRSARPTTLGEASARTPPRRRLHRQRRSPAIARPRHCWRKGLEGVQQRPSGGHQERDSSLRVVRLAGKTGAETACGLVAEAVRYPAETQPRAGFRVREPDSLHRSFGYHSIPGCLLQVSI